MCTLLARTNFKIILASNNRVRRPMATTSLEVEPEGAPFVREWLLAIRRNTPIHVAGLAEVSHTYPTSLGYQWYTCNICPCIPGLLLQVCFFHTTHVTSCIDEVLALWILQPRGLEWLSTGSSRALCARYQRGQGSNLSWCPTTGSGARRRLSRLRWRLRAPLLSVRDWLLALKRKAADDWDGLEEVTRAFIGNPVRM